MSKSNDTSFGKVVSGTCVPPRAVVFAIARFGLPERSLIVAEGIDIKVVALLTASVESSFKSSRSSSESEIVTTFPRIVAMLVLLNVRDVLALSSLFWIVIEVNLMVSRSVASLKVNNSLPESISRVKLSRVGEARSRVMS